MSKYKINKNKPLPTDEKIKSHMDFNKLVGDYNKIHNYKNATKPLYKNPKFLGFIALLSTVILMFIITERENEDVAVDKKNPEDSSSAIKKKDTGINNSKEKAKDSLSETSAATPYPPSKNIRSNKTNSLAHLQVPYKSYTIDPKLGSMIYRKNGTRIIIPPDCFVDKQGNALSEKIRIDYREFKDPVDFYFSGITMNYDSGGIHSSHESAGMFEILGFNGNDPVFINKEKLITVELLTASKRPSFNTYYFEKDKGTWVFKGKEEACIRFIVEGNEKDYPELKPFRNMLWEFSMNEEQKNPSEYSWIFSRPWNKFFVSELPAKADKKVELRQNKNVDFSARPVALLNDKEANDRLIKSKFDEYYLLISKKKTLKAFENKLLEDSRERQLAFQNSDFGRTYAAWAKTPDGKRQIMARRVTNIFKVNNFGIYNCDYPQKYPKGASIQASFKDDQNKPLAMDKVVLADYQLNSIFYMDDLKNKGLTYNPKSSNVLWEVLPDEKMAIYKKEQFKAIQQKTGAYTFLMKVIDLKNKNLEDIRKELGFKTTNNEEDRNSNYENIKPNRPSDYERIIHMEKRLSVNEGGSKLLQPQMLKRESY